MEAAERLPGGYLGPGSHGWNWPEIGWRRWPDWSRPSRSRCPTTPWRRRGDRLWAAEGAGLVDPQRRARVELAEQRLPLLAARRKIPPNLPPDQIDRKVLAVRREDLFGDSPRRPRGMRPTRLPCADRTCCGALRGGGGASRRRNRGDRRRSMPRRLSAATRAGRSLSSRPAKRLTKTRRLATVLAQRQRAEFLAACDVRLLRESPEQFAAYRAVLADWALRRRAAVGSPGDGIRGGPGELGSVG